MQARSAQRVLQRHLLAGLPTCAPQALEHAMGWLWGHPQRFLHGPRYHGA